MIRNAIAVMLSALLLTFGCSKPETTTKSLTPAEFKALLDEAKIVSFDSNPPRVWRAS